MKTAQDIGERVRVTRKRLALRQDQLAAAAGVGVRFIVELEAGKPTVQLAKTLAVLQALGLQVELRSRHGQDGGGHA